MISAVKEIIEKYINIIEQGNIKMLLYLAYKDRYNNFEVYQLRSALDEAGVCSLDESKNIAEQLFQDAFIQKMKFNKLRVYPSLKTFLYGDRAVRRELTNLFGLDFNDIVNFLTKEQDTLKIQLFTEDPHTKDRMFKYRGTF